MPLRDAGAQALASRSASAQTGHIGRGSRFVDEDEPRGVEVELALEPVLALLQDIRAILLARMARLFCASSHAL